MIGPAGINPSKFHNTFTNKYNAPIMKINTNIHTPAAMMLKAGSVNAIEVFRLALSAVPSSMALSASDIMV